MSIVLAVYSKRTFKEYLLPTVNNADYQIVMPKQEFDLSSDLTLKLEVLSDEWKIRKDPNYIVYVGVVGEKGKRINRYEGKTLKDGDVLTVYTAKNDYISNEMLSIIVREKESAFHSYEKYDIKNVSEITIGKEAQNDICCNFQNMVSKEHAVIKRMGRETFIYNKSPNGTYINSVRIDTQQSLTYGDYINIMGFHMIFLDDILALDEKETHVVINKNKLRKYESEDDKTVVQTTGKVKKSAQTLYHRSPRNYERLDTEVVEIENPPEPARSNTQPLFLTIGPSVTMALPMLLGCMMMIYSSQSQGGGSSLYMYSGLIMSLSSAIIGVGWALANIRYQKKTEKEQEAYRFESYSNYLSEKTEVIRNKYENTVKKLSAMYPGAEICLSYDENGDRLWNRNKTHGDFITHRLGLGDIPFQAPISVAKKKFTLLKDDLAEKPQLIKSNFDKLYQVPVTMNLCSHPLIGIVGGKDKAGAYDVVRTLTAQIVANNCYTDVKLGFIYNKESVKDAKAFEFARWFPHVWSEDKKTRYVASTKEEASDVFYELTRIFRNRMEDSAQKNKEEIPKPYYIVFISDMSLMEGELFSKYVFDKEQACGLTTILLAERYEELPNRCEFVIQNDNNFKGMYNIYDDKEKRLPIKFDYVDQERLDKFARNISGIQVLEMEEGGEIPNGITFFEMMGINKLSDLEVKDLWAKNRTYENIKGLIGQKAGGAPCYLDVHEKYHGPHGLVAGTTGSGKSETLQTYMLSLAVNYSPDDIGFFIIDYKGGGMANLFNGLPHMIGQISNLSGNQVKRAMISIKSENKRRQRVFSENGVNNINAYTKLYKNGEAQLPVPHLFIIIDEFAELKREEPDFMKELISVAQVGRSLGVHLILATQKPSGTVDDNIWSNSKFRLCLRVQDKNDSNDMLHKPDAAFITQAGRCYLQVGNDEVYELFQSGYSGALYDKNAGDEKTDIAKMIGLNGKVEMTGNKAKASRKKKVQYTWLENLATVLEEVLVRTGYSMEECVADKNIMQAVIKCMYDIIEEKNIEYAVSDYNSDRLESFVELYHRGNEGQHLDIVQFIIDISIAEKIKLPEEKEKTQLEAVKEYLAVVAKENGYTHEQQLWMPVLSDKIYLNEFEIFRENNFSTTGWKENPAEWTLEIVLGKVDDPENQAQIPLTLDFASSGHVAVCGGIVCGKSTMMQTMIYSLIQSYAPDRVNVYGLDFSSKMMSAFEHAPHVGGIMYENDLEKIGKFFHMLEGILKERKTLFRGGNYSQYVQVNGVTVPAIFVFIDNYSAFKEKTGEAYEEFMVQLSKEGVNHGIFLVVSGAAFGMNDITQRVGENIGKVLCLNLPDKFAYGDMLHNTQFAVMPESGVKGRGLADVDGRVLEYQTALAVEADNDYDRMEVIKQQCEEMKSSWNGKCARRIPEIPEKPVWSEFSQLDDFTECVGNRELLPVGYDAANASVYSIPLRNTYCYLAWGTQRSGKSNFLRVCLQSALYKTANIVVFDGPGQTFKAYKDDAGIRYITTEDEAFEFFTELLPEFKRRNVLKNQLLAQDMEEDEIYDVMSEEIPYFIFISDLSWFVPFIYDSEKSMSGFLENIIEKGRLHNIYFISEMSLDKKDEVAGYKIYDAFAGHKTGIHFGGKVDRNPVLSFNYIPFMEQSKADKVGIGRLPEGIEELVTDTVVVPFARR